MSRQRYHSFHIPLDFASPRQSSHSLMFRHVRTKKRDGVAQGREIEERSRKKSGLKIVPLQTSVHALA